MESTSSTLALPSVGVVLEGDLQLPQEGDPQGLVVFVHGSGSSRFSSRNRSVAAALRRRSLATLLFDLLTAAEEQRDRHDASLRFDIPLLAERLVREPSRAGLIRRSPWWQRPESSGRLQAHGAGVFAHAETTSGLCNSSAGRASQHSPPSRSRQRISTSLPPGQRKLSSSKGNTTRSRKNRPGPQQRTIRIRSVLLR
jgi:hypothetical protein